MSPLHAYARVRYSRWLLLPALALCWASLTFTFGVFGIRLSPATAESAESDPALLTGSECIAPGQSLDETDWAAGRRWVPGNLMANGCYYSGHYEQR